MAALGLKVITSQSPTTKIIENRFDFFQTICATIPGQIGRTRGEMEHLDGLPRGPHRPAQALPLV